MTDPCHEALPARTTESSGTEAANAEAGLRGPAPARTPGALLALLEQSGAGELVEATATWLTSGRRESPNTRTAYARDVSWWLEWCRLRGRTPTGAGPVDADQYAAALAATGLAVSTRARRLAATSSWYTYLIRAQAAAVNPFEGMERPRVDTDYSPTRGLSRTQIATLLAYARTHETPRTFALLALLYLVGARVGSLLSADIEDLGDDSGHRVIDLHVKGGKRRRRPLPPLAVQALDDYLAGRGRPENGALFVTKTGRRLDEPAVFRLIRRVARDAGLPHANQLSPHSLRHAHATIALDQGAPLHVVQDDLGHADPRTTRRYDRARHTLTRTSNYLLDQALAGDLRAVEDEPVVGDSDAKQERRPE